LCAAQCTASAATSGWKIGGTGIGCRGIFERQWSNWGVFRPGSCTIVMWTFEPLFISSVRTDSKNPFMACFEPQ